MSRTSIILLAVVIPVLAQGPAATITTPKMNAIVGTKAAVAVQVTGGAWPLFVVHAPDGNHYPQPLATSKGGGSFVGEAYFGNANTADGAAFDLTAYLTTEADARQRIAAGATADAPALTASNTVRVYRDALPQGPAFAITSPTRGSTVQQQGIVALTVRGQGWPVLFIKAPDGTLYPQPLARRVAPARWVNDAYFGDENTWQGTPFQLLAYLTTQANAQALIDAGPTQTPPTLPAAESWFAFRGTPIRFGGQSWSIKRGTGLGPGPNDWTGDPADVFLDANGALNLTIRKRNGKWLCSEVNCNTALGYGTYGWQFTTNLTTLDLNTVLGLFTYENPSNNNGVNDREIDFELSRWSVPNNNLGQFVVQPYVGEPRPNLRRFAIPANTPQPILVRYKWQKGRIDFACLDANGKGLAAWTFKDGDSPAARVPVPGRERAMMNLWLFGGAPDDLTDTQIQRVKITAFRYTPL